MWTNWEDRQQAVHPSHGTSELPPVRIAWTIDASHDESSPAGVVVSVRSTAVSDLP